MKQKYLRRLKGRIVDVYRGRGGAQFMVQGIKKDKQPIYNQNFFGSNGTYITSDETYPALFVKVSVYDFDNKAIDVDIREEVMAHFDWQKVTDNRVTQLKDRLKGQKIVVVETEDNYTIEQLIDML